MTILQRLARLEKSQGQLAAQQAAITSRVADLETMQEQDDENQTAFAKELDELRVDLDALAELVGDGEVVVPKPGPVTIFVTSEIEGALGMADAFTFDAKIEQTDPADIENTRITITGLGIDGVQQVKETGKPVLDADGKHYSTATGFTGSQGDSVMIRTVNLDDADPPNESAVSEETLTLLDTKAPQKAGAVTLVVTGETETA